MLSDYAKVQFKAYSFLHCVYLFLGSNAVQRFYYRLDWLLTLLCFWHNKTDVERKATSLLRSPLTNNLLAGAEQHSCTTSLCCSKTIRSKSLTVLLQVPVYRDLKALHFNSCSYIAVVGRDILEYIFIVYMLKLIWYIIKCTVSQVNSYDNVIKLSSIAFPYTNFCKYILLYEMCDHR